VIEQTKQMNPAFFKKLDHICEIFDRAFFVIREGKIDRFDQETIQGLISHESE
jgi:hypothetical protein